MAVDDGPDAAGGGATTAPTGREAPATAGSDGPAGAGGAPSSLTDRPVAAVAVVALVHFGALIALPSDPGFVALLAVELPAVAVFAGVTALTDRSVDAAVAVAVTVSAAAVVAAWAVGTLDSAVIAGLGIGGGLVAIAGLAYRYERFVAATVETGGAVSGGVER